MTLAKKLLVGAVVVSTVVFGGTHIADDVRQTKRIAQLESALQECQAQQPSQVNRESAPEQQTAAKVPTTAVGSTASVQPGVPTAIQASRFQVWKSVRIGDYKSVADLRKALKHGGFQISDWASSILDRTPLASQATTVDLAKVTVAELGFQNGATTAEIYARARERGLELCPAEVGPVLRMAYNDQAVSEWLAIGMEQIAGPDGRPRVFSVKHDEDGLWLDHYRVWPDDGWGPGIGFVFRLRK